MPHTFSRCSMLLLFAVLMVPPPVRANCAGDGSCEFDVNIEADVPEIPASLPDHKCNIFVGACSLRAAVMQANASFELGKSGPFIINLPPGSYTLSLDETQPDSAADGDLRVTAPGLTIRRTPGAVGDVEIKAGPAFTSTLLSIAAIDSLRLEGLQLIGNGNVAVGALSCDHARGVTLKNLLVRGHGAGSGALPGAILATACGRMTVEDVVFRTNAGGIGGALQFRMEEDDGPADLFVRRAHFFDNEASVSAGAIAIRDMRATQLTPADIVFESTTITGNRAPEVAAMSIGGEAGGNLNVSLRGVTIARNETLGPPVKGVAAGHGALAIQGSGSYFIANSILAGNFGVADVRMDLSASYASGGFNLIGTGLLPLAWPEGPGDLEGVADPELHVETRSTVVGPIDVLVPSQGSPAHDAGNPASPSDTIAERCLTYDATANTAARVNSRCDIGAIESLPDPWVFHVTETADQPDASAGDGACSAVAPADSTACTLRAAVMEANALHDMGYTQRYEIRLDPGSVHTLSLDMQAAESTAEDGDLDVAAEDVRLVPTPAMEGSSPVVTVDGDFSDRLFDMAPGVELEIRGIDLSGTYLTDTDEWGGAVRCGAGALLRLRNLRVHDNAAGTAAGVYAAGCTVDMADTEFLGNHTFGPGAANVGAAILIQGQDARLTARGSAIVGNYGNQYPALYASLGADIDLASVTISGNVSQASGAVYVSGAGADISLRNVTLTRNEVPIPNPSGALTIANDAQYRIRNSIIAGNEGYDLYAEMLTTAQVLSHNLLGTFNANNGGTPWAHEAVLDPQLESLAPLGFGVVASGHHPLAASPAVDAGNPAPPSDAPPGNTCTVEDQAGHPRNGPCDIGAVEYHFLAPVPPGLPNVQLDSPQVAEGPPGATTSLIFSGQFSIPYADPLAFLYTVRAPGDGDDVPDASPGVDFVAGPAVVLPLAANQTIFTVPVGVLGDAVAEAPLEELVLRGCLADPVLAALPDRQASSCYAIAPLGATGTIIDDDGAISSFVISDESTLEGDSGSRQLIFTVSRSSAAQAGAVNFAVQPTQPVSAEFGTDYTIDPPAGTLSFGAGVAGRDITVTVFGDSIPEADELFEVKLSNPVPAATQAIAVDTASGTIVNDDTVEEEPSFSIADASIEEGDAGNATLSFAVTRSQPTIAASVTFQVLETVPASAAAGIDFTAIPASGTLQFAAGQAANTVEVLVHGDTEGEPDETLAVVLSNASVGAVIEQGFALGTIRNDDLSSRIFANGFEQ